MATLANNADFCATTAGGPSGALPQTARTMLLTAPAMRDEALRQRIGPGPRLSNSGSRPSFFASAAMSGSARSAGIASLPSGHGRT